MDHQHQKQIAMRRITEISTFVPQRNLSWSGWEVFRKELTATQWEIPGAGRRGIRWSACSAVANAVPDVKTESGEPSASCTTESFQAQATTTIPQSFEGSVHKVGNLARAVLPATAGQQRAMVCTDFLRATSPKILPAQQRRVR